jgi:hypothetical protein
MSNNPNDPVEFRIKRLINSIHPLYKEVLMQEFPQLVSAAKDSKSAKREWLFRLYQRKNWIDSETVSRLREMDGDSALSELEAICFQKANLRPQGFIVPKYRSPLAGEELGDYIRLTLASRRINPERLKVRELLKPRRVNLAIHTGCDRDSKSKTDYHGGYDGEKLAMIRCGITSTGDTLYLANLRNWSSKNRQKEYAVLVYSPDGVEGISPLGDMAMVSNGFHAFPFSGDIKQRSLLAVFERDFSLNPINSKKIPDYIYL